MSKSLRSTLILCAIISIIFGVAAASLASEVSEGQVVVVQDWVLFVRTASGEPLSFTPYWVNNGTAWVPSGPGKITLPALESGEMVRVTWSLEEREGRRRIDAIEVISSPEGATKGIVWTSGPGQLVIRPKDEPGTVTMNPPYVRIENRWVPDPEIANKLRMLERGTRVTVEWRWDNEGRKRITGLAIGW
ncbi:MAG: hypothetical protein Q7N50_04510 [Armatimonadota bacterium]|nr:hypothetical protein [Armatimonadota bacterium]